MKKAIIAAAALALMIPARAETFEVGTAGDLAGLSLPFDGRYTNSVSQSIYTKSELNGLYKVNADGSTDKAEITSVTVDVNFSDLMWVYTGGEFETTVYVTNSAEVAFVPDQQNRYSWLPYDGGVTATATWTGYEDGWDDAVGAFTGIVPVTLTFSEPLTYEGESLVFTWLGNFDNAGSDCTTDDGHGWAPGEDMRTLYACSDSGTAASLCTGTVAKSQATKFMPSLSLDYTMVTEAAPGPVRGEPAEFAVGPYDAPDLVESSSGFEVPVGTVYAHYGAQTLYTPDVLNNLNKVEADGKISKAEISEITFLANTQAWDFNEGSFNLTVYVQNVDAVEFDKDSSGKIKWFEYSTAVSGNASIDINWENDAPEWENTIYGSNDIVPVTIKLDTPIMYEGGSLLMTWEGNSTLESQLIYGTLGFRPSDKTIHSANCASDSKTFADFYASGYPQDNHTFTWLPVLKLSYVPVTEMTTVTPVMFENVEVALEGLSVDPAVASRLGNYKTVNNVAVRFSLNDASACGEYEIKMGSVSLGTIRSTDATVNFVSVPNADIVLSVVPKGEGTVGTTCTVAAADIAALFPAPAVEVADYGLYTAYDLATARRATIEGAAQFRMTTPVPAARMMGSNATGNARLMTTSGDYPECLEHLVPANATTSDFSDLALNDGLIAYYSANLAEAELVDGELSMPDNLRISVEFKAGYPVLTQAVPALTEGRGEFKAEGDADITSADGRTVALREVDFAGDSYPRNACVARLLPDEAHFTADVTYPAELKVEVDKIARTIKFTAPAGTTLWYAFTADEPAAETYALDTDEPALDWTKAPANPWVFDMALNGSGTLQVKTVNDTTSDESEISSYRITADGSLSGIADATLAPADSAAEYYDLRGVRVDGALAPGLYIRRQGGNVTKVLVK